MSNKNTLIAIDRTPHHPAERMAAHSLADALQLRMWDARKPLTDACAAITGIEPVRYELLQPDDKLPMVGGATVAELEERIAINLRVLKRGFFIDSLTERMTGVRGKYLYSGNLITGITTPEERYWVRSQGGTIINLLTPGQDVPKEHRDQPDYLPFWTDGSPDEIEKLCRKVRDYMHWKAANALTKNRHVHLTA